jgi:hypothetical protein
MVTASIGPSGELLALWASTEGLVALNSSTGELGGPTFPNAAPASPVSGEVTVHAPRLVDSVVLVDIPVAHPSIQPLPGGRVLAVGARCRWRPEGPDQNAVIYDSQGQIEASGTVGDGVQHVMTTPSGQIWIGYFDEGIFGNYGWGSPGPEPLGVWGLVRFNSDFDRTWQFTTDAAPRIDDCYALNVIGEGAWTCYYSDFPIVRISDEKVRPWTNSVTRSAAIVVGGSNVALVGGGRDDRSRYVVGPLGQDSFEATRTAQVVLPDGSPLPGNAREIGRGNELHVIVDNTWYKLTLE